MRNNTSYFWVLLLVHGVFGYTDAEKSVSVSVMEGDSVTLHTDLTEVQRNSIIWTFGNVIIAKMNEADAITYDGADGRFRDRLKLDKQTGSLTIMNIRTEHVGLYSVDIKGTDAKLKTFEVTAHDVVSVSVMEGDTITLHTGVIDIQRDDQIQWMFGDEVIRTDGLNSAVDSRWRNIHLNNQTGELNISNIRRDQSGDYKLEINTINMILHRKFRISRPISGDVFSDEKDGVKTVSETRGDSVLLHTHITKIQQNDPIEWTFGPQNIPVAKTDGKSNSISYNYNDVRFKNRLYLDIRTGDLTIKKSSSEHSGLYQLKVITSSYTIQKSLSVTVSGSGRSGAVSGISGVSVGLMVWAVTVFLLQEV